MLNRLVFQLFKWLDWFPTYDASKVDFHGAR